MKTQFEIFAVKFRPSYLSEFEDKIVCSLLFGAKTTMEITKGIGKSGQYDRVRRALNDMKALGWIIVRKPNIKGAQSRKRSLMCLSPLVVDNIPEEYFNRAKKIMKISYSHTAQRGFDKN